MPFSGLLNTKFEHRLDHPLANLKKLQTKNRVEASTCFNAMSNSYLLYGDCSLDLWLDAEI